MLRKVINNGFTLAEVLITLGIIGVVAAMTIPTLMTNYAKHRTETQLVKFYSMMNQTLRMSVAENGDPDGWVVANKTYTYDENVTFLYTYILPYMKNLGYENCSPKYPDGTVVGNSVCVYLMDGSVLNFYIDGNGGDIAFFTEKRWLSDTTNFPRHRFKFQLSKISGIIDGKYNSVNYIEPYTYMWDGTKENLKNHYRYGCHKDSQVFNYCAKYIQMNSWKIPSDYPW